MDKIGKWKVLHLEKKNRLNTKNKVPTVHSIGIRRLLDHYENLLPTPGPWDGNSAQSILVALKELLAPPVSLRAKKRHPGHYRSAGCGSGDDTASLWASIATRME